jgi:hypothetical protein
MPGQPGLFDRDERAAARSAAGDPLERLAAVVDFELFGDELDAALDRADRTRGGRPPYAAVLMVKVLVLQTLYTRSDDQTEYQIRDRLWFLRFLDRALEDRVPEAKTIWLFGEQLTRAGTVERRFQRFDAVLRDAGHLAMGGQIVDATVIQARRPRLSQDEKATVKGGGIPKTWPKAKRAQMATDGAGPSSAAASDWLNAAGRKSARGASSSSRSSVTRTTAASTAATASSAPLPSPPPPLTTAASSASCSIGPTPRARSGLTALIARRPTLLCWHDAGWCRVSSGPNRAAGRCRRIWCAAMPAGRGSGSPSSTSSPLRSAASVWSSARSASPAPPPGSGAPTWSPTCAASLGSRRGWRRCNLPCLPPPARYAGIDPATEATLFIPPTWGPRPSPQNRFFEVSDRR